MDHGCAVAYSDVRSAGEPSTSKDFLAEIGFAGTSTEGSFTMQITDNEIRGRKVIAADGNAIGQVGDLIIDSERWAVEFVQIKLRKEVADAFGATHGIFHSGVMEIPVRMVQSLGDTIVLAVPTADLRSVVPGATTNRGAKAAD